jgi:hypothetical protein
VVMFSLMVMMRGGVMMRRGRVVMLTGLMFW